MVCNDLFHHVSLFFFFFFAIANLKNFSWCNVIQQIKKVSPYVRPRNYRRVLVSYSTPLINIFCNYTY